MRCSFCARYSEDSEAYVCGQHGVPDAVSIMSVDRQSIFCVDDWLETSPPKRGASAWKDGYSAKECAKAWFRGGSPKVPAEMRALWRSTPEFAELEIATAYPEVETELDDYRGGRNADMLLLGMAGPRTTLVAVEAKAGEDFGPQIGPYLKRVISGTNVPERVDALSAAVFGRPVVTYDPQLVPLRYQLLHALAGTAIEAAARCAEQAAMVIHYFENDRRAEAEAFADFARFVLAASQGTLASLSPGQLYPLVLAGGGKVPFGSRVWVGWATARAA